MTKVGLLYRERIIDDIKKNYESADALLFFEFSKVTAFAFNKLRNSLRREDAVVFVTKNSLFEKSLSSLNLDSKPFLEGATALVFMNGPDIVKIAKIIVEFSKEHEGLKVKGGFIGEKVLASADIESLSKLPSREVLLAMAVSGIASPLTGFLSVMNQVILKFLWTVEAIQKSKSE